MSDVDTNVTDLRLHYQGGKAGFVRVEKARHISIRREKGESDGDYAQRLMEAQDRQYAASEHRWGYVPKSLRPEDEEFLDGFLLAQKKKMVTQASKNFDDACWDGDLTALCRCVNQLSRYFKARGGGTYDSDAFRILQNIMTVPNLKFYKQDGDNHPALSFNMPADKQDFRAYCSIVVGAMQLYVQNAQKGMEKVESFHDALLKRKEKGAFPLGLEHAIVFLRDMHADNKAHRLSFGLKDDLLNPLDWAYHEDVLDFVIKTNSPLLEPALFSAYKKVEEWDRDIRYRQYEEQSEFNNRFWGKAVNEQGMVFAGALYAKLQDAIKAEHPREKVLESCLEKLEVIRMRQFEDWVSQKNILESRIKHMRRALEEENTRISQSWGVPTPDQ